MMILFSVGSQPSAQRMHACNRALLMGAFIHFLVCLVLITFIYIILRVLKFADGSVRKQEIRTRIKEI